MNQLEKDQLIINKGKEIESLDRSSEEVAKATNKSIRTVSTAYHRRGITNRLTDFYGSPHIPTYIQKLYDWLVFQVPEFTIEINRKRRLTNNRLAYLQIYVVEKNLAILVDFDLAPELYNRMKILKINKKDFDDPLLLSKSKVKIMKTLKKPFKMYNENELNTINILEYIKVAKNMEPQQYRNKLYFDMINKSFRDDRERMNEITNSLNNYGFGSSTILSIKKEVNNSSKKLKNIISFFEET